MLVERLKDVQWGGQRQGSFDVFSSGRGGGLASVFKNSFCCRIIETDTFTSFEFHLFSFDQMNSLMVAVVYHPPKTLYLSSLNS